MNNKLIFILGSLLFTFGIVGLCTAQKLTDNAISKITGGHSGPCVYTSTACGGTPADCDCGIWDAENIQCTGHCTAACPRGGSNQKCLRDNGPCWRGEEGCGERTFYRCIVMAGGTCIARDEGTESCGTQKVCH